jgi:2-isopropylmalate synthase
MQTMKQIKIFDTTLRDGQQGIGSNMTLKEKIKIAKSLELLGVDIIEAGFPISSKKEYDSVKNIAKIIKKSKICALARHNFKDIDVAIEAVGEKNRLHIFIPTSDIHIKYKLNLNHNQLIKKIEDTLLYAKRKIKDIEWSSEDATRTNPNFLFKCIETAIKNGATTINIADTVGYTTPNEFNKLINAIYKNVKELKKVNFSVHCHNDLGLAVANSLEAIQSGANQVECTINGIGERAGNASLEEIVMSLKTRRDLFKSTTKINTKKIKKVSELVAKTINYNISPNKPIIGRNAFAHESGIHQDGVLKNRKTYEIMNPEDIGVTNSELYLSSQSGLAGIKFKLKQYNLNLNSINLNEFVKFFKLKVKNFKRIDKGMLINLYNEFQNKKN